MASWLEFGQCPDCGGYVASECETDTGEIYYWHTETGQRECLTGNTNVGLREIITEKVY